MNKGVYAAALTPMHADLSCNYALLADHCRDMINRGCQGVVLCGTTGEGTSFSVDERVHIIKKAVQLGVDPERIIVGICCSAINDALKLATAAVDHNCAAVLMTPPFFYKNVDEEGTINFYRKIIQSVGRLKLLLYHIPKYSGVPITLNVIKTLREEFPNNVIGIKESEGNLAFIKEILSAFADFKIYAGNERLISESVALGAVGGISGIANAYPELICSLYEKPHSAIEQIMQELKNYPTFPAIKGLVAHQKGPDWRAMRPPLIPLNQNEIQALLTTIPI